jgi:hypothetical protein
MPNTAASQTSHPAFEHRLGAKVVVEVSGRVVVRQESERGLKYIIQPHDKRATAIHASPEFVFAEDGEASDPPHINITHAGRAYLLLMDIIGRLHIDGDTATFKVAPFIADELASFGAENEDLEMDDPAEDSDPAESGHDNEADIWFGDDQSDEKAVHVQTAGKLEPRERP